MARSAAADGVDLPVRPGDVLDGRFRIDSVLGVGGMGAVYAATHMQLAQRVAIKVILPGGSKEEVQRLQRLLQEARVVAQMKSPHVTNVLDVGTLDSGLPYMVMELLEGVDFERHLEGQGVLAVADAVDYVLQVCEAVAEAHSLGVIHRDLKPSNLFLTKGVDKRPLVKVLDFGLAKSLRDEAVHGTASITRPLEIMGTPSYMSPEQLRSTRDVDERTDIWSLGVILYELVAGRLPFDSPSIPDLCAAIVRDAPPRIEFALPVGLEAVIQKCLQKYPKDRYPRITELAVALAPYTGDPERIERVKRVQRQETIPPEQTLDAPGPISRRRPIDAATQSAPLGPLGLSEDVEAADLVVDEDEPELTGQRPGLFGMRRLGIPLLLLFIGGTGGGTALLAMKLMDDPPSGRAAATRPSAAPSAGPSSTVATAPLAAASAGAGAGAGAGNTDPIELGDPSPVATGANGRPIPGTKPMAAGAGQRPARPPTPGGRPTSTPPATAASGAKPAAPADPDKLFQSR